MLPHHRQNNSIWLLFTLAAAATAGCGGSSDNATIADSAPTAQQQNVTANQSASVASPAAKSGETPPSTATTSSIAENRQMIGDIPLDVFFDDPLTVYADSQPVAGTTVEGDSRPGAGGMPDVVSAAGAPSESATEPAAAATAAGGVDWKSLISAEIMDSEVTAIRNYLNERLQTVSSFNGALFEIPRRTATLAALTSIAPQHPDAMRWKDDALYLRDLAAGMQSATLQRGAKSQREQLASFESILDLLNGSRPAAADAPEPVRDMTEVAEMRLLMQRMDTAFNSMKTGAGSEDNFKTQGEMVRHESAILATLTKIVCIPDYGYGDDPGFLAHANPLIESAQQMSAATANGDFTKYDAGLSRISQACAECHTEYKND